MNGEGLFVFIWGEGGRELDHFFITPIYLITNSKVPKLFLSRNNIPNIKLEVIFTRLIKKRIVMYNNNLCIVFISKWDWDNF